MPKKSIILSSSGLKNLVPCLFNNEDEFRFILGDHEIKMSNISAEFISPSVSRLHFSDSSCNFICFNDIFEDCPNEISNNYTEIFTDDIISLLHQISCGYSIDLDEKQSIKMRFISLLLGNEELFQKLNQLFPLESAEANFENCIDQIQLFQCYSQISQDFDYSSMIDNISSHFYLIDKSKLLQLPKSILYSIISNKNLKILTEDSLFEFINQIFKQNQSINDECYYSDISLFYEQIEFYALSEEKFLQFIQNLNVCEISTEIWSKLKDCFYIDSYSLSGLKKERYGFCEFIYNEDDESCFDGIIQYLNEKSDNQNISDKGLVDVTSSSTFRDRYPKYIVDLDSSHFFMSENYKNSWIKIDFKDKKVRPDYYSIRSRSGYGSGSHHLKNWCIEGSNSGLDDDWKVLDSRNAISCLDDSNASHAFNIQTKLKKEECFRFLRLRQTGVNTGGHYYLALSAIEFYGILI